MENKVQYSINKLPKVMNVLLCMFPLLGLLLLPTTLDNDFYFLYEMGEYISSNGFPVNDILSMHSDMKLVIQQWLCDVLYYNVYNIAGFTGMFALLTIVYLLYTFILYKLCKLVSNNFFVSISCTTIFSICLCVAFFTTRPQVVTYLAFLILFYALEAYIKTKKIYWLSILPLLSIFLINWHASMWWLLFVFMLPYLVNAIPVNIKKVKQEPCCNIFALLATMAIMFGVGFINPYGKDAVMYLFGSYGVDSINKLIQEMHPTSMEDGNGVALFVILGLIIFIFAFSKKTNIQSRYLCLTLGTLVLALSSLKGIAYFLICIAFSLAYFLKDFDYKIKVTESKRTKKEKIKLVVLVVVLVVLLGVLCFVLLNDKPEKIEKSEADNLEEIVAVLDEKPKNSVILFTDFNTGQYLEYRGYKAYIDGRAEVFLTKNNKSFDYFNEYVDVKEGKIYYKEFVDKYGFTYLIVNENTAPLFEGLKHDEDYQIICENGDYTLFELKK